MVTKSHREKYNALVNNAKRRRKASAGPATTSHAYRIINMIRKWSNITVDRARFVAGRDNCVRWKLWAIFLIPNYFLLQFRAFPFASTNRRLYYMLMIWNKDIYNGASSHISHIQRHIMLVYKSWLLGHAARLSPGKRIKQDNRKIKIRPKKSKGGEIYHTTSSRCPLLVWRAACASGDDVKFCLSDSRPV